MSALMTQEMLEITQADEDAAEDAADAANLVTVGGHFEFDIDRLAAAFARHRIAATAGALGEIAEDFEALITDVENKWGDPHTLRHAKGALARLRDCAGENRMKNCPECGHVASENAIRQHLTEHLRAAADLAEMREGPTEESPLARAVREARGGDAPVTFKGYA